MQPNKAIVGRNAFAHESGIHQDGILKDRSTYEIMDATTVGLDANQLVLGKHSGRHALRSALEELGYQVDGQALNTAFKRFKELADKKKQVTAMDLEALVTDELREESGAYTLEWFDVEASSRRPPHATVGVRTPDGEVVQGAFTGDGPIDAVFRAINAATGLDARLREFRVDAVTGGQDALGEVAVVVELGAERRRARRPAGRAAARARHRRRPGGDDRHHRGGRHGLRASADQRRAADALAGGRGGGARHRARHAVIDARALAADAAALVQVPSVTGDERGVLERLAALAEALGLRADLHEHDLAALRAHPGHPGEEARARGAVGADGELRRRPRASAAWRSARTSTSSPRARCPGATGRGRAPWRTGGSTAAAAST